MSCHVTLIIIVYDQHFGDRYPDQGIEEMQNGKYKSGRYNALLRFEAQGAIMLIDHVTSGSKIPI
ncbi:hypothetical protein HYN43_029215 [Mucilaginibacter celer]|uniref:Uncharacterized protein n=1 Tax=Mucilaginibacter celer TaxID=2305508 RepID=A0A494W720_9SPHI|nr:hypothetical protein HYN43_029215 [Mucilaginibacter celer]